MHQYLSDPDLRKAVIKAARNWADIEKAGTQDLLQFHPMSKEVLKQKPDMDVYCLMAFYGELVRTHVVSGNGHARTNPPPEEFHCDSCHTRGWLKQDFQYSMIDGANISVWLCPACSKLKPAERDIRF